jgi:HPr kinase/phosphorylase
MDNPNLFFRLVAGEEGLDRPVSTAELNRPTSELHGYSEYFRPERIQLLGMGEVHFIEEHGNETSVKDAIERIFSYDLPCVVISNDQPVPPIIIQQGDLNRIPIFVTPLHTTLLSKRLWEHLEAEFAESTFAHAVLVEVYDVGVLIVGQPGIGKSELALELISRGHRLVADDVVKISCLGGAVLMGYCSEVIPYHIEIRGLGIVDIHRLFGARSVLPRKRIGLIAQLERWDENKRYERIGIEDQYYEILRVKAPAITIPVQPGRHVSAIIEVACLDRKLKDMGVYSAREMEKKISDQMRSKMNAMGVPANPEGAYGEKKAKPGQFPEAGA